MELELLGPRIEFLTNAKDAGDEFCMLRGTLPPGTIIPLHSHSEREAFLILSGEVEFFIGDGWNTGSVGDVFDIAGNTKHALKNPNEVPVILAMVTTQSLADFFQRAGRPPAEVPPGPPSLEAISNFNQAAIESGYWLGSLEDNAAIGLALLG